MAGKQSAQLERKKFFADPIMVSMIVVLLVFSGIVYPVSAVDAVSGQLLCGGYDYTGCIQTGVESGTFPQCI